MKKIFLILILVFTINIFAETYGLLIGISNYEQKSISKLKYSLNDVNLFEKTLVNLGLADQDNIIKLLDASKTDISKNISKLIKKLKDEDTVYFFFSGHGLEMNNNFYILPADADTEELELTAVNGKEIENLYKADASRIIIIIDACHSGSVGENKGVKINTDLFVSNIKSGTSGSGKVMITSSKGNEESKEDSKSELGLFTKDLISELENLNTSKNIDDIMKNVIAKVKKDSGGTQTPQIIGNGKDIIIFKMEDETLPDNIINKLKGDFINDKIESSLYEEAKKIINKIKDNETLDKRETVIFDVLKQYYNGDFKSELYSIMRESMLKKNGLIDESIKKVNQNPEKPMSVFPKNKDQNIITKPIMKWECKDPDGDNLVYDVYLDTEKNPKLIVSNFNYIFFTPSTELKYDTIYYMRVVARDGRGGETSSDIWTFKTIKPISADKNKAQELHDKGNAFFQSAKYSEALDSYNKAIEADKSFYDIYFDRSWAFYILKKYSEAVQDISIYLEMFGNSDAGFYSRGVYYYVQSKYDESFKDFTSCIKLNSKYYNAYWYRGLLNDYFGRFNEALGDYTTMISLESKNITGYTLRADLYSKINQNEYAVYDYNTLIMLNPNESGYYFRRALCYDNLKKYDFALKDYKKYLDMRKKDPEDTNIQYAKKRIAEIGR